MSMAEIENGQTRGIDMMNGVEGLGWHIFVDTRRIYHKPQQAIHTEVVVRASWDSYSDYLDRGAHQDGG
jgi:hypothetical protein